MLDVACVRSPRSGCPLIVPVREGTIPAPWRNAAAADGFVGRPETVCEVFGAAGQVVLVGLGDRPAATGAAAIARVLRRKVVALEATGLTPAEAAEIAAGACQRAWHFPGYFTTVPDDAPLVAGLEIVTADPAVEAAWAALAPGLEGAEFARNLVMEPANFLSPQVFVQRLQCLVEAGVTLQVMDAPALAAAGFGGLLAVGRGAANPPCLAVLRWPGRHKLAPVAFVGKGITFDTGGICVKPAHKMWEMRADMAGAASCAGAMLALARRRAVAPAIAVLALAENAVGAASYRPGDVLRMFNGSTVQVVDTDAEGRLVLADALAFAVREKPRAVIDLATLTGSIAVALGHLTAGVFSNDPVLAAAASAAGAAVDEPVWHMPIGETHRRALDSDIADIKHCVDGKGQPDACQAAAFLREFVGETPWLHLDIAGVDTQETADARHAKGASGFGVRLLDRLMTARFEKS